MDEIRKLNKKFHHLYDEIMRNPLPVYEENPSLKQFEQWSKMAQFTDETEPCFIDFDGTFSTDDLYLVVPNSTIKRVSGPNSLNLIEETSKVIEFNETEMTENYLVENEYEEHFFKSGHDLTLESLIKQDNENLERKKDELECKLTQIRENYLDNLVKMEIENIKMGNMREKFKVKAAEKSCKTNELELRRTDSLEQRIERFNELTQIIKEEKEQEDRVHREYRHLKAILKQTEHKYKALYNSLENKRSKIPQLLKQHKIKDQIVKANQAKLKDLRKLLRDISSMEEKTKNELLKEQSKLIKPLAELSELEKKKKKLQEAAKKRAESACQLLASKVFSQENSQL